MAILRYNNVKIDGISAVVPKQEIDNGHYSDFFTESEVKNVVKLTGIAKRRFAPADVCSSDLCFRAATLLLQKLDVTPSQIDAIIMVTLTPDYRMPGTAFLLHSRLGLRKGCIALDISLGCSGFIHGFVLSANLLQQKSINKVLLLNGETKSKTYGKRDKSTSLLFGDAGTATLFSKSNENNETLITLNTDGSRADAILIEYGGYRNPSSLESLEEKEQDDGSWRSGQQGMMDGPAIFDFTITEVPADILNAIQESGKSISEIDHFIFHQANKFITDHIAKKIGVPKERVPYSLDKYGNTASASIPLTICSELNRLSGRKSSLCLSAFGVGLSWGTILTELSDSKILSVSEY